MTLHEPLDLLPDSSIATAGDPIGAAFAGAYCATVREAAAFVWQLPYGRNDRPDDPLCVIDEGRGTCSTKHALLARLLAAQGIQGYELRLGIYEMDEANTPGVGRVLAAHGLALIPEAHCYLWRGGRRIDVTRVLPAGVAAIGPMLREATIAPEQIGAWKREFHRGYLEEHAREHPELGLTAADLWRIREECIAALAE